MRRWLLVVLGVLPLIACTPTTPASAPAKERESELSTSVSTITDTFPTLPPISSVRWVERIRGDERVPGPSTYHLEAVIQLANPADLARFSWSKSTPDWARQVSPKLADQITDPALWSESIGFDKAHPAKNARYAGHFTVQVTTGRLHYLGTTM